MPFVTACHDGTYTYFVQLCLTKILTIILYVVKFYNLRAKNTAWSTMTESVGNETIEKYWCFLIRNRHWPDFLTWNDIKNIFDMYVGYVYDITKMNLSW
jgi:hypothetical protein